MTLRGKPHKNRRSGGREYLRRGKWIRGERVDRVRGECVNGIYVDENFCKTPSLPRREGGIRCRCYEG